MSMSTRWVIYFKKTQHGAVIWQRKLNREVHLLSVPTNGGGGDTALYCYINHCTFSSAFRMDSYYWQVDYILYDYIKQLSRDTGGVSW